jgi:hypothetical protein
MNERIKELALQADAIILGSVQSKSAGLLIEKWEQKFAELIIKECCGVIMNSNDRYRREYFANIVQEHFGVES